MDIKQFWLLIDQTRNASDGDADKQAELLTKALVALPLEDIIEYQHIFDELDVRATGHDLLQVVNLIYDALDDSVWRDFRAWLIGQGQTIYENAIANPETLADVVSIEGRYDIVAEPLIFAAEIACEIKADDEDAYVSYARPDDETIKDFSTSLAIAERKHPAKEKFPRAWAKFGWENPE